MENALNNLQKTQEANNLVALLGEQGLNEYLISLLEKVGGNFDEAVKHMRVHGMAVQNMKQTGMQTDYAKLMAIPTASEIKNDPIAYPTPAPQGQRPAPSSMRTNTQVPRPMGMAPQPTPMPPRQNLAPTQQPRVLGASAMRAPNPSVTPSPSQTVSNYTNTPTYASQGSGNVVNPFQPGAYMTEDIGGYVGHAGQDFGYDPSGSQRAVTNPIGGIPFAGYQSNGYGNYYGVIGGNEQEIAQMSPEERQALIEETRRKMGTASSLQDLNIPGKNVSIQGHLNQLPNSLPNYVATGSAQLQMGSTGRSTALHTHQEIKDIAGKQRGLADFARQYGSNISIPKGQGGTGGGFTGVVAAAQKAFSSIGKPTQTVARAGNTRPTPTPAPKPSPAPKQTYKAPVAVKKYTAPTRSPTPTPMKKSVAPTYSAPKINYSSQKSYSAPKPSPTPAPRSYQPMQSTYKPVTYSRPSPQQNFFAQTQKALSNLFKFK